jgi:hypothetical protein
MFVTVANHWLQHAAGKQLRTSDYVQNQTSGMSILWKKKVFGLAPEDFSSMVQVHQVPPQPLCTSTVVVSPGKDINSGLKLGLCLDWWQLEAVNLQYYAE